MKFFRSAKSIARPGLILALAMLVSACDSSGCGVLWQTVDRGPYLQNMTSTSMVIKWRGENTGLSEVRYGISPDNLVELAGQQSDSIDHEVLLRNLKPDTRYFYKVNNDSESVFSFKTPPMEGSAKPIRVWVVGDSGTADDRAESVKQAFYDFNQGSTTDLMLMLGDNAYDDGTDCEYQRGFFDMYPATIAQTAVMPTIGNHDAQTDNGAPYFEIFTLPSGGHSGAPPSGTEAYYSFNYANIHFVSLDSETSDRSTSGAMYNWLMADLAASTQDWTVVYFHHPPYSKGTHDSDAPGLAMEDMREHFTPVFEMFGVDLVLTGHSHVYERSFPIRGHRGTSDTFLESMKTDAGDGRTDGDGEYRTPIGSTDHGVIYTVAGSSGKTRAAPLDHPVHYIAFSELGSLVLDFDDNILDVTFVSPNSDAVDYFSVVKTK